MKILAVFCVPFVLMACAPSTEWVDGEPDTLCTEDVSSSKSAYCLIQNAEKGDAEAQYSLGSLYYYGKGVRQDYKEAGKWWRLSAAQEGSMGQSYSQYNLALLIKDGKGVEKNLAEAARLLGKSQLKEAVKTLDQLKSMMIKDLHQRCLFKNMQTITNDIQHLIVETECARRTKRMNLEKLIKAYEED